ncbi:hypothetical protein ABPG75_011780 [Micractinium tetrahymenae]
MRTAVHLMLVLMLMASPGLGSRGLQALTATERACCTANAADFAKCPETVPFHFCRLIGGQGPSGSPGCNCFCSSKLVQGSAFPGVNTCLYSFEAVNSSWLAEEIDDLLASGTAAAPLPLWPPLIFGLAPATLSKAVAALIAAMLLLWVGASSLVHSSGPPSHGAARAHGGLAPTPAAADILPWMRQRPDHLALIERWGLPQGPGPQPPPEFYPSYLEMWQAVQSVVQRANMLKYFIMHSIGGMYMNLDAECWRPVDPTLQGADIVLQSTGGGVTNGQFAGIPGHPVWQAAIDVVHNSWKQNPNQQNNSLAGPVRMNQAFRSLGLQERKGQEDPWAGVHQLDGNVRVHAVRSWFLLCHHNEPECFKTVSLKRAVGLMLMTNAAGLHRYSASWISGGNQFGLHSEQALLKAACPKPSPT